MEKHRKQAVIISTIGVIMILFGVTYSFFNYTRTGVSNTIKVGRISFESEQTNTITLVDVFPIDKTTINSSSDVGTVTINVEGDTTYDDGVEYQLSVSNLTNTVGNKEIPIDVVVTASGIGDSEDDYFTERGGNSSIYNVLTEGTISNNKQLLVGYITKGSTGIDGTVTVKAYLDKEKIAISDTYPEGDVTHTEGEEPNQITVTDYTNGTTDNWVDNRLVLTTTEWNNIHANGVSFQVKVEANEGIWVEEPLKPICRRAVVLYTEECTQMAGNYCSADGYSQDGNKNTTTITYGNLGIRGNVPDTGDAFDCDVTGDGNYTERFYYVSDYFDTNTMTFDNTTATLIYYSNTINGVASNNGSAYYETTNENWHGPVTAIINLPTNQQWSNVKLKKERRAILAEQGLTHNATSTTGGVLPTDFSYSGYAARLLTAQEVIRGCALFQVGDFHTGELSTNCTYLMENTKYASSNSVLGSWLETPRAYKSNSSWYIYPVLRSVNYYDVNFDGIGVRPAIDVPMNRLDY